MFDSFQKSTGTTYTATTALLILAFVYGPAVLILTKPLGLVSVALAVIGSAVFATLAWIQWTKHSQLTIPTLEPRYRRVK